MTSGQTVSFDFVLEFNFVLLEEDSYRRPNELFKPSAGGAAPIGDLLSHTAKSKSREALVGAQPAMSIRLFSRMLQQINYVC